MILNHNLQHVWSISQNFLPFKHLDSLMSQSYKLLYSYTTLFVRSRHLVMVVFCPAAIDQVMTSARMLSKGYHTNQLDQLGYCSEKWQPVLCCSFGFNQVHQLPIRYQWNELMSILMTFIPYKCCRQNSFVQFYYFPFL